MSRLINAVNLGWLLVFAGSWMLWGIRVVGWEALALGVLTLVGVVWSKP